MGEGYHRLLLLFVDGVGLAPAGAENPLASVPTPALSGVLGGPLVSSALQRGDGLLLAPLDATLGMPGLPQSATGQTALFTGVDAAREVGGHVVGFPGPRLRAVVERASLFRRLVEAGVPATFANAYTPGYLERVAAGEARASVTTCAVAAAGLAHRGVDDLAAGRAVTWDVRGDLFARRGGCAVAEVEPEEAGRRLARLAGEQRFTLFETFLTDLAGHRRWGLGAEEAMARVDGLLAGALAAAGDDLTVLLTSDHGNLEDATSRSHTRNPVPWLVVGAAAGELADLESILDVTPAILRLLAAPPR